MIERIAMWGFLILAIGTGDPWWAVASGLFSVAAAVGDVWTNLLVAAEVEEDGN